MTSTEPATTASAVGHGLAAAGAFPRRTLLGLAFGAALTGTRKAHGFGDVGAFHPRILLTATARFTGVRARAPAAWSMELARRTSAPARLVPTTVRADEAALLDEPFAVWAGAGTPEPLTRSEVAGLRRFLVLGGLLFVDDSDPASGEFTAGAKRELRRVLPVGSPLAIGPEHVVFRTFYLLGRAVGRTQGDGKLEAIVRGGQAQVLFSRVDLLGALARSAGGVFPLEVVPGGERQREQATRLAVNVAMYVLCSDYKDDQVHAPGIMRRRAMDRR